jgi:hypothetical protein
MPSLPAAQSAPLQGHPRPCPLPPPTPPPAPAPLNVAPYHTLLPLPRVTLPTTTALGATNTSAPLAGSTIDTWRREQVWAGVSVTRPHTPGRRAPAIAAPAPRPWTPSRPSWPRKRPHPRAPPHLMGVARARLGRHLRGLAGALDRGVRLKRQPRGVGRHCGAGGAAPLWVAREGGPVAARGGRRRAARRCARAASVVISPPRPRPAAAPSRAPPGLTWRRQRVGALHRGADAVQGGTRGPQHAANAEQQLAHEVLGLGVAPQLRHREYHGAREAAAGARGAGGSGRGGGADALRPIWGFARQRRARRVGVERVEALAQWGPRPAGAKHASRGTDGRDIFGLSRPWRPLKVFFAASYAVARVQSTPRPRARDSSARPAAR